MRLINSMFLVVALGLASVTGCGSSTQDAASQQDAEVRSAESAAQASTGHDHGGWWCTPHGVPEGECALCDASLIADFKDEGDWCDQHDRPESQCFLCDATRFDRFAARYEAKFGEQPPKPIELREETE